MARPPTSTAVLGLREDWSDGTHTLTGPYLDHRRARAVAARIARYWSSIWARPRVTGVRVIFTSRHELRLHHRYRDRCTSPDCPGAAPGDMPVA